MVLSVSLISSDFAQADHKSPYYGWDIEQNEIPKGIEISDQNIQMHLVGTLYQPMFEVEATYSLTNTTDQAIEVPFQFGGHLDNIMITGVSTEHGHDNESHNIIEKNGGPAQEGYISMEYYTLPANAKNHEVKVSFDSIAYYVKGGEYTPEKKFDLNLPLGGFANVSKINVSFETQRHMSALEMPFKPNKARDGFEWTPSEDFVGFTSSFGFIGMPELLQGSMESHCFFSDEAPVFLEPEVMEMKNAERRSSYLAEGSVHHDVCNLIDEDLSTVWAEGVEGNGVGEWFSVPVHGNRLHIYNGYVSDADLWAKNNRVKKIRMYQESANDLDGYQFNYKLRSNEVMDDFIFELADTLEEQIIELPHSLSVFDARFEILEVYEGTEYDDTVVAEVSSSFYTPMTSYFAERIPEERFRIFVWNDEVFRNTELNQEITKAEAAYFILALIGEEVAFVDAPSKAKELGIINSTKNADKKVNLAEFAVMTTRAMNESVAEGEHWYSGSMDYMRNPYERRKGEGAYSEKFSPEMTITLREVIMALSVVDGRVYDKRADAEDIRTDIEKREDNSSMKSVSVQEFKELLDTGRFELIQYGYDYELSYGKIQEDEHIIVKEGNTQIGDTSFEVEKFETTLEFSDMDKNQPYLLYGWSPLYSQLKGNEFTNNDFIVYTLIGGIKAWEEAGYELIKE